MGDTTIAPIVCAIAGPARLPGLPRHLGVGEGVANDSDPSLAVGTAIRSYPYRRVGTTDDGELGPDRPAGQDGGKGLAGACSRPVPNPALDHHLGRHPALHQVRKCQVGAGPWAEVVPGRDGERQRGVVLSPEGLPDPLGVDVGSLRPGLGQSGSLVSVSVPPDAGDCRSHEVVDSFVV